MYSQGLYGGLNFGEKPQEIVEFDKNCKDLMKYLPSYYQKSHATKEIMKVHGCEIGFLELLIEDFRKQMYIETATWGLVYYEKELGLKSNLNLPIENRREMVKAKLRGRGTTTKQMIKNTAEAFAGGQVEVIEKNSEYTFIIKFVGVTGVPKNMKGFLEMLEIIKPAHLQYKIEYTFISWGHIRQHKWENVKEHTWYDVKANQDLVKGEDK